MKLPCKIPYKGGPTKPTGRFSRTSSLTGLPIMAELARTPFPLLLLLLLVHSSLSEIIFEERFEGKLLFELFDSFDLRVSVWFLGKDKYK